MSCPWRHCRLGRHHPTRHPFLLCLRRVGFIIDTCIKSLVFPLSGIVLYYCTTHIPYLTPSFVQLCLFLLLQTSTAHHTTPPCTIRPNPPLPPTHHTHTHTQNVPLPHPAAPLRHLRLARPALHAQSDACHGVHCVCAGIAIRAAAAGDEAREEGWVVGD
jgi:hypothetical protein